MNRKYALASNARVTIASADSFTIATGWQQLMSQSLSISSILPDQLTRYFADYPDKHTPIQTGDPPPAGAQPEQWLLFNEAITKQYDARQLHNVVLQRQSAYRLGVPGYYGEAWTRNLKIIADLAFVIAKLSPDPRLQELAAAYGFAQDVIALAQSVDSFSALVHHWDDLFSLRVDLGDVIEGAGRVSAAAGVLGQTLPGLTSRALTAISGAVDASDLGDLKKFVGVLVFIKDVVDAAFAADAAINNVPPLYDDLTLRRRG